MNLGTGGPWNPQVWEMSGFPAELITKSSVPIYSNYLVSLGKTATFYVDVLQSIGTGQTLNIDVEHTSPEEDSWTLAGSFAGSTGVGLMSKAIANIKRTVRLKLWISGPVTPGTPRVAKRIIICQPSYADLPLVALRGLSRRAERRGFPI